MIISEQDILNLVNNFSKFVGTREVLKSIISAKTQLVVIAKNADNSFKRKIVEACKLHSIPFVYMFSKQDLSRLANIDVGCACIGISKF